MRMNARTVVAVLLLAACAVANGCQKSAPPSNQAVEPPQKSSKKETPPATQAATLLVIDAVQLAKDFATDEKAAVAKYPEGTLVEVEGFVQFFTGGDALMLKGYQESEKDSNMRISCGLIPHLKKKAKWLSDGQKVRVKGKIARHDTLFVDLENCEYQELSPKTTPIITAEKLLAEYGKDKDHAVERYGNKELIVQGVIVDVDEKRDRVILKGPESMSLQCEVSGILLLKTGQEVTIKGLLWYFVVGEGMTLRSGWILEPEK